MVAGAGGGRAARSAGCRADGRAHGCIAGVHVRGDDRHFTSPGPAPIRHLRGRLHVPGGGTDDRRSRSTGRVHPPPRGHVPHGGAGLGGDHTHRLAGHNSITARRGVCRFPVTRRAQPAPSDRCSHECSFAAVRHASDPDHPTRATARIQATHVDRHCGYRDILRSCAPGRDRWARRAVVGVSGGRGCSREFDHRRFDGTLVLRREHRPELGQADARIQPPCKHTGPDIPIARIHRSDRPHGHRGIGAGGLLQPCAAAVRTESVDLVRCPARYSDGVRARRGWIGEGSAGSSDYVGRSKAIDRPVWPLARLRRYSSFDAFAVEWPA